MQFFNIHRSSLTLLSLSSLLLLGIASETRAQITSTIDVVPNHQRPQPISTRASDLLDAPSATSYSLSPLPAIAQIEAQALSTDPIEPTIQPVEQGVRVPPSLNEGVEIEQTFIYLRNAPNDVTQHDSLKHQISAAFGLRAGSQFSSLFAERGVHQVEQLPFVQTAEYRLYEAATPGRVIVAVLVTLQPQDTGQPQTPKKPSGILVNGDFSQFPTLYQSDRALFKTILNAGFGVFSDTNSWFDSTSDFVRGRYQPRDTITWPESYIEAGIAGITQIGNMPLYAYGAFSFTESATLAPDIFRDDVRFYGAIEKGYGGLLYAEKGSPISFNLSAGRQNFQLNRNFLFGQVLGSANALERGASFLNARTVYDNAVLANVRIGNFLIQGFYLNPNELPIADSESRFLGVNLKYNDNRNLELALAYITMPESNTVYLFPNGQRRTREGLQAINPRLRWTSPLGVEGLWIESEYVHEWNNHFDMSAHAGYIWIGYTFKDVPWRPSISYRFAAFSGDNPKTASYERFDSLRGGGLGDWLQGINLAKVYTNSNLLSHRVELKINPSNTLQFSLDYFYLFANQLNNLGGVAALSSLESRSIGHELMFTTRWSVSQNLFLLGVTSIAFPSSAIRRAVTEDPNPWFTFQISLFLGF